MTVTEAPHIPVLKQEIITRLNPQPGYWLVDATFGAGGHTEAFLSEGASVLAIDRDPDARARAARMNHPALTFTSGDFRDLECLLHEHNIPAPQGILMDLGVSSMQLDEADRGFAFRHEGPLDMRMSAEGASAADLIASSSEAELAAIIYRYGEERHSRRIARAIVAARAEEPILTTERLDAVIRAAYPPGKRHDHPSRRTFQALRIAVNDELGALEEGLEAAGRVLALGGHIAVLSYHSLEDRIVKHFFKNAKRLSADEKRPYVPTPEEIKANPRARSAKLRSAVKVTE